ncbi:thioredoxin family protein [Epilithonimonas xixisoli]|uniref:AhpC/TSA family protein n=1 Tax=Epilithonimonas xixisoli TaxID=1476462 RepID=A0A4R8I847_9FLAO|nr:thioredoxin family protein [Epilithonimonas xixisoli]TDX84635.1 AhpC/TSA family protein [Epilithonimonas xixisoli]
MKKIKWLSFGLILILGLLSFSSIKNINSGYQVGDEATDFKLKNIDGKMVSLSDYKSAKGFIVIFTCNHCPYAKKYEDRIVALDKMFKSKGYPVIAINPNDATVQPQDGFAEMQTRAKEKSFTFPYLVDEGQKIYPIYGATKTPHVYILKKENGKNIVKYIGAIDNNYENPKDVSEFYVQDAVNQLLKNEAVKTEKTVAIGCTIKVKK